MADRPQFGKRRPQPPPDMQRPPAPKRSRHVALLVMGTFAVGGGAYALMGRENCQPAPPGMAAPAPPQGACNSLYSGYHGSSSGFHFYGGDSSGGSEAASSGVSRGGFGGFAHAFGSGRS
jgi:hypothetical protein